MKEVFDHLFLDGKPGRTALVNGREFLFFTGYNYLGINSDPEFIALMAEGLAKYGWLHPSSRISNTRLAIYEECEALLSELTGTEATALLSSGYAAGRAATGLYEPNVCNAPQSHPAILQNLSEFTDFSVWRSWLIQEHASACDLLIIAGDSVNPLTSAINDFSFLSTLNRAVTAIIDDSHGIGVIGNKGSGMSSLMRSDDQVMCVYTYSLAKAFGIVGGAVSGPSEVIAAIKSRPEYSGATALSPAQAYAFVNGQHIYHRQREKLKAGITYFEAALYDLEGIQHTASLPVFMLPVQFKEQLFHDNDILISAFAYPDPTGKKLQRVVLNALHTFADLDRLASVVKKHYYE